MVNRLAYRPTSQAPAHPSCGVVAGGPHPLVRCSDLRREQEPMEERGRLKKRLTPARSRRVTRRSLFFLSPYFFSFFFFFSKQAKANTFLKQGYSFGWLELAARCSAISPTLGLLCKSQVCNFGISFQVCSNSKEHHSVQLM